MLYSSVRLATTNSASKYDDSAAALHLENVSGCLGKGKCDKKRPGQHWKLEHGGSACIPRSSYSILGSCCTVKDQKLSVVVRN